MCVGVCWCVCVGALNVINFWRWWWWGAHFRASKLHFLKSKNVLRGVCVCQRERERVMVFGGARWKVCVTPLWWGGGALAIMVFKVCVKREREKEKEKERKERVMKECVCVCVDQLRAARVYKCESVYERERRGV